ncbi:hypothetical protein [Neptunicella sp. SCSIO 80796]|uniref:hypothetical protein n=1 Tax=Neptunicella plasticusilytica TaxID=3117012 RepID=UPI003A4D801E
MKKSTILMFLTALICFSATAEIRFSGFATVAAGMTSGSDETFNGYDDDFDMKTGSFFAIQGSSDLGEGLSATVQILSRGENDWDPKFAWAYLSYEANDEWRILLGRQRAPLFLYSDYLDVSYAYHWIRPPAAVYDLPFDSFDGVGSIYTANFDQSTLTTHIVFGNNTDKQVLFSGTPISTEFKQLLGGSVTWNYDWLTLRGAYFQSDLTFPFEQGAPDSTAAGLAALQAGWAQTPFASISDELDVNDDRGVFTELGLQIDLNDWLFVVEGTKVNIDHTILPDQSSWYASLGKRMGSFMLHATYGKNKDTSEDILGNSGVPVGADPTLDFLYASTQGALDSLNEDSDFYTLGARWNFHDSAALKFEFTSTDSELTNQDANLFQLAIVSVF